MLDSQVTVTAWIAVHTSARNCIPIQSEADMRSKRRDVTDRVRAG